MRIFLITTGLSRGGAERQVLELAREFRKFGHKVIVLSLGKQNSYTTYSSFGVINFNLKAVSKTRIKKIKKLAKLYKKFRPGIIHSHMFHANIFARFISLLDKSVKVVNTAHSHIEGSNFRYFLYYLTRRHCDIFTTVSYFSMSYLANRKIFRIRAEVIYNGIRTKDFLGDNPLLSVRNKLTIGIFGRLASEKNIAYVLKLYGTSSFLKKYTKLSIFGSGPEYYKLLALVSKNNLQKVVKFHGPVNFDKSIYSSVDIVLIPSQYESFSLVALEAILAKRLVLISKNTGIANDFPDLVNHICLENTLELESQITDIRNAYLHSPQTMHHIIEERCKSIAQFDIGIIAKKWLDLYQ